MSNACSQSQIEYIGNGYQVLYSFSFTYLKPEDIYVYLYDADEHTWVTAAAPYTWVFVNSQTIEFATPPPIPSNGEANIKIRRETDLTDLLAQFNPGSAIRAIDLNNNFEQLQLAAQEGQCGGGGGSFTNSGVDPSATYEQNVNDGVLVLQPGSDRTTIPLATTTFAGLLDPTDKARIDALVSAPASKVIVGDDAPTVYPATGSTPQRNLEQGDLWFDSYSVLMYMWYVDEDGGQWVATAIPGPKGADGSGGGSDITKTSQLINDGDNAANVKPFINDDDVGKAIITIAKTDGTTIGSFNVNQTTNETITLPSGTVPSEPGNGILTIEDNDGNTLSTFTANQATGNNETCTLPVIPTNNNQLVNGANYITAADIPAPPTVGDGTITINQGGSLKGSFTVNQSGNATINLDAGGGGVSGDYVKLDDEGVAQTITGGGGLDVVGGITTQFGSDVTQLGNVAPLNAWSVYPARQ